MPTFTLKRLLWVILLIAIEIAIITPILKPDAYHVVRLTPIVAFAWLALGAALGIGAFAPSKHLWLGAIFGLILHLVWMMSGIVQHSIY
jgi:hypothetical protein